MSKMKSIYIELDGEEAHETLVQLKYSLRQLLDNPKVHLITLETGLHSNDPADHYNATADMFDNLRVRD